MDYIVKSRQRHASNVLWMTALMNYINRFKSFSDNDSNTIGIVDKRLDEWILLIENEFNVQDTKSELLNKFLFITDDSELIGFRKIAFQKHTDNKYKYSSEKFNEQIEFELKCLPAQTINLVIPEGEDSKKEKKRLEKILKLSNLTRKIILLWEKICEDERMEKYFSYSDENKNALKLYTFCTRVRSSTLNTLAPDFEIIFKDSKATTHEQARKMAKFYKEWGEKAGAPFYGKRRDRSKGKKQMHEDDPILSIWAGAHLKQVDPSKSVLGMMEWVFNLPERCDISGTTTDAVGYGLFSDNIKEPDLFVFLVIYSMMLSGHHSLFETCTAASLWSSEFYAPFEPLSIIKVLGNLYDKEGKGKAGGILKDQYKEMKLVVTGEYKEKKDQENKEKVLKQIYWYIQELWQDLGGMTLPGEVAKTRYWGENLEISQSLYVMAEKLCSLAHNVTFK